MKIPIIDSIVLMGSSMSRNADADIFTCSKKKNMETYNEFNHHIITKIEKRDISSGVSFDLYDGLDLIGSLENCQAMVFYRCSKKIKKIKK